MKPLTKDQERGMLKQAPAGALTAFLYDNAWFFDSLKDAAAMSEEDLAKKYKHVPRFMERLNIISMAMQNTSITGAISRLDYIYRDGIKAMVPSAHLADAMALTEANYSCDDFKLPYKTVVIEIPPQCRGHIRMMRDGLPTTWDTAYGDLWDINMEEMYTTGSEARFVILSEVEYEEDAYYKEFDGHASRHIAVEIITTEFLRGEMAKPFDLSKFMKTAKNLMVFNPSPVATFSRPLIHGRTVDDVIMYHAGVRDDSPGTIKVEGDDAPLRPNQHYTQASEQEYMVRIARMAMNVMFALVNMGYDEEKKVAAPKLIQRGGREAQRAIPDVLSVTVEMNAELKKIKYDDSTGHSGIVVTPHFRRGHWRKQRHGEGKSLLKSVWIAPTIVNRHLLRDNGEASVFASSQEQQ